jgi:alpha-beta hydrolase superfamily lysophospholipase
MKSSAFTYNTQDDKKVFVYKWSPESGDPKALILIVHGLAEHADRYADFAEVAVQNGYIVYAPDLRGQGKTALTASGLGILENNGWNFIVNDLRLLTNKMKDDYPNLPLFLFGHSLGGEISQDYMIRWGSELNGVVLSAPQSQQPLYILLFGELLGKMEIKKLGPLAPSKTFKKLAWEKFNKPFKPEETDFDWISTDSKEVRKYADDNLCGWVPSTVFSTEITRGFKRIHKKSNREMVPNDLPIFIVCGTQDSTNNFSKSVKILIKKYLSLGKNIEFKFYPEKRHDLLHEVNRVEVTQDILKWLNSKLK